MPTNYDIAEKVGANFRKRGLAECLICEIPDFETIAGLPAVVTDLDSEVTIADAHTFLLTAGFQKVYMTREKSSYTSQGGGEVDAETVRNEVTIFIPGTRKHVDAYRKRNPEQIVLVKDANCSINQYLQIGDECNPAKIDPTHVYQTGTTVDGQKGYEIKLYAEQQSNVYYEGGVTMTTEPAS